MQIFYVSQINRKTSLALFLKLYCGSKGENAVQQKEAQHKKFPLSTEVFKARLEEALGSLV